MKKTPNEFVAVYGPMAVACEKATGVPALVTLAQAACESGWAGNAPGNMFFGVKADPSWKGKTQLLGTTEEDEHGVLHSMNAYFRAYPTAEASFEDHAAFLHQNGRYHKAFEAIPADVLAHVMENLVAKGFPQEEAETVGRADIFAWFIAAAHYATDSGYYDKIRGLVYSIAPLLAATQGRRYRRAMPAEHPSFAAVAALPQAPLAEPRGEKE